MKEEKQSIKKTDLQHFYNEQADKYHSTRNKYWSDWDIMVEELKKNTKDTIKILELWCWSGRLITYLNQHFHQDIEYIWVDISENLLYFAQKDNPNNTFICEDMTSFLEKIESDSFDYIISIASFQHLINRKERGQALNNCFRVLKLWWKFISINRSFSNWFLKKYRLEIVNSILRHITSFWNSRWNDILVPWKTEWHTFKRFYHILTLKELRSLLVSRWFHIEKLSYLDKFWKEIKKFMESKNSFVIAKK